MTVFTPRSQQSKEKTAKICDYFPFLTMRLDRVAQVLSLRALALRARSLVCYSASVHAELNAMFHSDQKGDSSGSPFSFIFHPKSRVFSRFSVTSHPNASAKPDHIKPPKSPLTTCLTHSLTTWWFSRILCEKI